MAAQKIHGAFAAAAQFGHALRAQKLVLDVLGMNRIQRFLDAVDAGVCMNGCGSGPGVSCGCASGSPRPDWS